MAKPDLVRSLQDIYGDKADQYLRNLEAVRPGLSPEELVREFEMNPTDATAVWCREPNIRYVAYGLLEQERIKTPRILMAACGTGVESAELAARLMDKGYKKFELDAFDINPESLSEAINGRGGWVRLLGTGPLFLSLERKKLVKAGDGKPINAHQDTDKLCIRPTNAVLNHIDYSIHDIITAPFSRRGYDVVFANYLLMHYPAHTRELVLANLTQSVRDGGFLILESDEHLQLPEQKWLEEYRGWKKNLTQFGLTNNLAGQTESYVHRYHRADNQYFGKTLGLRNRRVVELAGK